MPNYDDYNAMQHINASLHATIGRSLFKHKTENSLHAPRTNMIVNVKCVVCFFNYSENILCCLWTGISKISVQSVSEPLKQNRIELLIKGTNK